jgi:hypothetical protein
MAGKGWMRKRSQGANILATQKNKSWLIFLWKHITLQDEGTDNYYSKRKSQNRSLRLKVLERQKPSIPYISSRYSYPTNSAHL